MLPTNKPLMLTLLLLTLLYLNPTCLIHSKTSVSTPEESGSVCTKDSLESLPERLLSLSHLRNASVLGLLMKLEVLTNGTKKSLPISGQFNLKTVAKLLTPLLTYFSRTTSTATSETLLSQSTTIVDRNNTVKLTPSWIT